MHLEFCLANIENYERWTKNELDTAKNAFDKAKQIQGRVSGHIANLLGSPYLAEKYPAIIEKCRTYTPVTLEVQETAFNQFSNPVMKHLEKTGQVEITRELATKVSSAWNEANKLILGQNLPYSNYMQVRRFLLAYQGYLERNETSWKQEPIASALMGDKSIDLIDSVRKSLTLLDQNYLDTHFSQLKKFQSFFTPSAVALSILIQGEPGPRIRVTCIHRIFGAINDVLKLEEAAVKAREFLQREAFPAELTGYMDKVDSLNARYIAAAELPEKFAIACEILNYEKAGVEESLGGATFTLDILCFMSLHSKETPELHQRMARSFINAINAFQL